MNTAQTQNPNGYKSRLVLIVTQGKTEPVIDELFNRLGKAGLEYATWHSDTKPVSYRRAIEESVGDILPDVRALVAGRGVPIREVADAVPNLRLAISTDPESRDTANINGGTAVTHIDIQQAKLISYGLIAEEILGYLANGSSTSAAPEP